MNRLWVRISLVLVTIITLIVIFPFLLNQLGKPKGNFYRNFAEEIPHEWASPEAEEFRANLEKQIYIDFAQRIMVGAVIGVIVGVLLSRNLVSPLKNLENGAKEISSGNLGVRVDEKGSQEFRSLAKGFNQMASDLEKQENLRSNLLADVTHELRHPAHLLQGNLRAIMDGVYPMSEEEIAKLFDQTQLLTTLVNDLHLIAQAEAGQLNLNIIESDLNQLIKSVVESYQPIAAGSEVSLDYPELEPVILKIDRDRIRQVIQNLIRNAVDHSSAGGKVSVALEVRGDKAVIIVVDQGEGVSEEQLPLIFNRFYRADTSRNRERPGSGLGLSISKAIIEAHGGSIEAFSEGLGKGIKISVGLPLGS